MIVRISRGLLVAAVLLIALGSGVKTSSAQNEVDRYFPETGHTVSGEFLTAYESVDDPLRIYGPPITVAFVDPKTNQLVQYFRKARFVLDPTAVPELRVRLSPLGKWLYTPGNPSIGQPRISGCQYFQEIQYQVCFAFLDFFDQHGGVSQFGYPISNFERTPNGRIVQYFQFARFEWHPELASKDHVLLGDLGFEYFKKFEDRRLSYPSLSDTAPQSILSLRVYGFTSQSVVPPKGEVTFFVVVQDQNFRPVSNARVSLQVRLPGEAEADETLFLGVTDDKGVASQVYPYHSRSYGLADLIIQADLDGLLGETRASFRIWR